MQIEDNRYSLVIEGGYEKLCWRLKKYPKKKEDVNSFMKQEVRGLVEKANWINPELEAKGYGIFINADQGILNLAPSLMAKRKDQDVQVNGNVLFLKSRESMVAGLMVDDIKAIMAAYPDIADVYAVMCEEVTGQLPQGLNIIPVNKDRI